MSWDLEVMASFEQLGTVVKHTKIKIFYGHSLPSPDSRRAVVSFWQKEYAQVLVNCT